MTCISIPNDGIVCIADVRFQCLYCGKLYEDKDDKYHNRVENNVSRIVTIKCECGNKFCLTHDWKGNFATFEPVKKVEKLKTYVLTVSKTFPVTHKRKGEPTFFQSYILNTLINDPIHPKKLHTIRASYDLWAKRIKEVQEGKAILSIRYWYGKPYNSKQVEICRLDKDSGVGVQKIIIDGIYRFRIDGGDLQFGCEVLAKNDGLSISDFKEWFKYYEDLKPMAIIHFTSYRY